LLAVPCRQAMCVGRCSRIVGPCLLVLGVLSLVANVLLLFPGGAWQYLLDGHINIQAKIGPGIWGGGIMVILSAAHITAVGWRCACCSDWHQHGFLLPASAQLQASYSPQAFHSAILSKLAFLGSIACFILSGVGLTNGPVCRYSVKSSPDLSWGYPFSSQGPDSRELSLVDSFLYKPSTWGICLEPVGIVTWHITLFSVLLLVSAIEMVLAFLQILNGCVGCLCGFCEEK
ncbi:T4S1 protein, partial [Penelope pileata]|nr:T4S1 protein [Penelope pileata]